MIGVDNITAMVEDAIAVRTGIRVARNGTQAPRGLWGGDQRQQVKSVSGYLMLCSRQEPPPPKDFRGFFFSGQPSRRTQSWGRKSPARQKRLNRWPPFTAGAIKTELVDITGMVSACQGWQPMRTVAQRWTKDSKGR